MTFAAGKIDVHHHMVPPFYAQALKKLGVDQAAGASLPDWTPEKSLALMDATGIAKAYLSVSCPGVYFGDAGAAEIDERLQRESDWPVARLEREHPPV